ncbi:MAG: hypothetical protein R3E79_61080 [Caldilineaceae bacterium]
MTKKDASGKTFCMTKYENMPLRPELVVCPHRDKKSSGRIGVHSQKERRYKCHDCGKTFSDSYWDPFYDLKTPQWVVSLVLTLMAYGCPLPAIVAAFELMSGQLLTGKRKQASMPKGYRKRLSAMAKSS